MPVKANIMSFTGIGGVIWTRPPTSLESVQSAVVISEPIFGSTFEHFYSCFKSCHDILSSSFFPCVQIKPPIPVKANFTFFEVTNPEELSTGGKPNLQGEQVKKI